MGRSHKNMVTSVEVGRENGIRPARTAVVQTVLWTTNLLIQILCVMSHSTNTTTTGATQSPTTSSTTTTETQSPYTIPVSQVSQ